MSTFAVFVASDLSPSARTGMRGPQEPAGPGGGAAHNGRVPWIEGSIGEKDHTSLDDVSFETG